MAFLINKKSPSFGPIPEKGGFVFLLRGDLGKRGRQLH